ncbi:putative deoxyribonuclease YjjV [mine drainage metagenome]|uniref:Putative deoxyribonuclease YjjV n=1 Tax=mine drainage metagenome TaxID=410659 RepID=A0A1J5R693_9ZZZZ
MDWIDTHAHLDAAEFDATRDAVQRRARAAGVHTIVIPAVAPANFAAVRALAHAGGHAYALGVHPLYVAGLGEDALRQLRDAVRDAIDDPRFVAIGEIGLDHFVGGVDVAHQLWWCERQLRLAREFELPVLLHVRRAQDVLAAALRRAGWGGGGIAHAFNGSRQQADAFIALGLRLGFGGAMTFERALNIRRLAAALPDSAIVLETDSPDLAPAWLAGEANEPAQLPRIGAELARLRGTDVAAVAALTAANAHAALPRLAAWVAGA